MSLNGVISRKKIFTSDTGTESCQKRATMKLDLLPRSHAGQEPLKVFIGSGVHLRVCSLQPFKVVEEY